MNLNPFITLHFEGLIKIMNPTTAQCFVIVITSAAPKTTYKGHKFHQRFHVQMSDRILTIFEQEIVHVRGNWLAFPILGIVPSWSDSFLTDRAYCTIGITTIPGRNGLSLVGNVAHLGQLLHSKMKNCPHEVKEKFNFKLSNQNSMYCIFSLLCYT